MRVEGRLARAAGTHVFGRVLTEDGRPISGVRVEIWQCDALGRYHHPRDPRGGADPTFRGYGHMTKTVPFVSDHNMPARSRQRYL